MKTTKDIFFKNGEYTEERTDRHHDIIQSILSDKGVTPDLPGLQAILLGGGSGSGKSSVIEDVIGQEGFVLIDSDDIKTYLDEFQEAVKKKDWAAADIVHEESSDIAMLVFNTALEESEHLIYDGTMKNIEKYEQMLKSLREYLYSIQIVVVDCDVDVAWDRVEKRNSKGRFVSEKLVRETNHMVAKSFLALRDLADSYMVLENSVFEVKPRIIAYKEPNEDEVCEDPEAYARFLEKSKI